MLLSACSTDENDTEEIPDEEQEIVEQDISEDEENDQGQATVVDGVNYSDVKITPKNVFNTFTDSHEDTKYDDLEYKVEGYNDSNEYRMRIDAVSEDIKEDKTKELDEDDQEAGVIT